MRISVALCTYNGEKFIEQQLESIINQTQPVDEIIICDDISSDKTIEIVERARLRHPLITLFINERNLGAVRNFEKAIGLCSGEVVFLSDQDDIWCSNKVEKVLEKFRLEPLLRAVFSNGEIIDESGKLLPGNLFEQFGFSHSVQNRWARGLSLNDLVYTRNIIVGATLAIKKNLFTEALPFFSVKGLWHDGWLGIHAAANQSLGWINESLIKYRVHSNQQIGIGNGTMFTSENKKEGLRVFLDDLKTHNLNCLAIVEEVYKKYPVYKQAQLEREGMQWITYSEFRLSLPKPIFKRIFAVIKNMSNYKSRSSSPLKSMFKDILHPC